MQPQTLHHGFTEGCKLSILHLSPTLLTWSVDCLTQICQTLMSHSIIAYFSSFQSLWPLVYFSLLKKWFLGSYLSTKTIPDQASLDCRRVNLASRWRSLLDFLWSHKEETVWNFSSDFESFVVLDHSWFLKILYNTLNTTFWVIQFVRWVSFGLVKFCDLWHFEWNDVIESWSNTI